VRGKFAIVNIGKIRNWESWISEICVHPWRTVPPVFHPVFAPKRDSRVAFWDCRTVLHRQKPHHIFDPSQNNFAASQSNFELLQNNFEMEQNNFVLTETLCCVTAQPW